MRRAGIRGGFREVTIKLGAARIVCGSCGLSQEVSAGKSGAYELWYATSFKKHRLWARNRRHLQFLISWFSGEICKGDLGIGDRDMVETFPKWMILAKNRAAILKSLYGMAGIRTSKPAHRARGH